MRKKLAYLFFLTLGLFWLLGMTSPSSVKLPIYLLVFSVIYIIFILAILIIASLAYPNTSNSERLFVAVVLSFCPVIVLALESMSTVSLIDTLLAISVPAIIVWYGLKKIY